MAMESPLLFALLTFLAVGHEYGHAQPEDTFSYAKCDLVAGVSNTVKGRISMRQLMFSAATQVLQIQVAISGVPNGKGSSLHGLHVHEYGDTGSQCGDAGGHFNPLDTDHGDISDPFFRRHVGDWGNVRQTNGAIGVQFSDRLASLYGSWSIYGRAIVLHELKDDLGRGGNEGSRTTGNAGKRLACCIVRRVSKGRSNFVDNSLPHEEGGVGK